VKRKNEVYARHLLATRRQEAGETLNQYVQVLIQLSRDCSFRAVTAEEHRDEAIREAFIQGIRAAPIRQRLLEKAQPDFAVAVDQARAMIVAHQQAETYGSPVLMMNAAAAADNQGPSRDAPDTGDGDKSEEPDTPTSSNAAITPVGKCFFCGYKRHPRDKCPAKDASCMNCGKKGHYARVCKSTQKGNKSTSAALYPQRKVTAAAPSNLSKAIIKVRINGLRADALIDTGSSDSFVNSSLAKDRKWQIHPTDNTVCMASTSLRTSAHGYCIVELEVKSYTYRNVRVLVLRDLCADVILGHNVLRQHVSVEIPFGGDKPRLTLNALTTAEVAPPCCLQTYRRIANRRP